MMLTGIGEKMADKAETCEQQKWTACKWRKERVPKRWKVYKKLDWAFDVHWIFHAVGRLLRRLL